MKKEVYLFETSYYKTAYIICGIMCALSALLPILTKKVFLAIIPIIIIFVGLNGLKMVFVKDIANSKTKKYLLKNGIKMDGKIVGFKRHKMLEQLIGMNVSGTESMDADVYTLLIKYGDKEFETPTVIYDPKSFFTTDECTVYVKDDKVFATDFNTKNTNFEIEEIIEDFNE